MIEKQIDSSIESHLKSDHGLDLKQLKRNKKIIDQEIQVIDKGSPQNQDLYK